jgi:hypothetical protein
VGVFPSNRSSQAIAVATLGVPGILLAHLLTTGTLARGADASAVTVAVLVVATLRLARTTAGLALVTATAQLVGHSVLTVTEANGTAPTGCLPAMGRGASLGLHLALLRSDVACPAGTLAPGPAASSTAATLAAVLTALTIIAGHGIAAAVTGALLNVGRQATVAAQHLGQALAALPARWRRLLLAVHLLVPADTEPSPTLRRHESELTPQWQPGALLLRGPPEVGRVSPLVAAG